VQRTAGNTAVLWPPPPSHPAAAELLKAAAAFADDRRIPLTQLVVSEQDSFDEQLLRRCGFDRLATLVYLVAPATAGALAGGDDLSPSNGGFEGLSFEPFAGSQPARLTEAIEQTYVATRDCPQLEGVRPLDQVLAGYRAQGAYQPAHWYLVGEAGRDVGVLILAHHPEGGSCELVYMGVVAAARGRGVGRRIALFAQRAATLMGAERVVLAVDEGNAPALAAYAHAGFTAWDRRIVYARLGSTAQADAAS
jgi:ribosomal protein S18 acetylase RimI-like enzyme